MERLMGYVKIGSLLVPESSKESSSAFRCRMCSKGFSSLQTLERHVRGCFSRNEQELREQSKYHRLAELHNHDREREQWLKSPAGRAWFRKHVDPDLK